MERSGWFDDDDDDSPSEPLPHERAWRHPSELGPHGAFQAATPRRRTGTRFVAALTLGTAGSLVIALLASVHAFGPTGEASSASNAIEGSVVGGVSGFTLAPTSAPLVAVLTSVETSTTVAASMPPVVKVHTADPNHTIRAALVDDGSLVTTIEELGDTTEGEAVLADGRTVKVTVYLIDRATGMAHLRADTAVDGAAEHDAAWMGVSCGDGREPAPIADELAAEPTPSSTAVDAPSTTGETAADPPASEPAGDATSSSVAAPTTVAGGSVTSRVSTSVITSAAPTTAASTTVAPAAIRSTVSSRVGTGADATTTTTVPVAEIGVTTTTETTPATTTTTSGPAMVAGVRVLAVFTDSPADGTLQEGDLITAIDGHPVRSTWALVLAVRQHPAGTTVTVEFVRHGHRYERPILLAPAPTR